MYLRIRPETPDDAPLIEAVTVAAFVDALGVPSDRIVLGAGNHIENDRGH